MLRKIALLAVVLSLTAMTYGQSPDSAPAKKARGTTRHAAVHKMAQQAPTVAGESLVRVLRTSNKAQTNHYVCDTLEFRNINPFNVLQ